MDIKYHAGMSAILALLYLAFSGGGNLAGAALILAVGIGMDVDHLLAYLACGKRNFQGNLLKNADDHYRQVTGWLCHRRGKPYATVEFMVFHNIDLVAAVLFAVFAVWGGGGPFLLPVAVGYLGHIALDLLTWHHIVFRVGTRTPLEAASYFSLGCRLLFGTGKPCVR